MPPKKLTENDERILAGWAIYRSFFRYPTTTDLLNEFAYKAFKVNLTPTWITNFNNRQHLSLHKSSTFQQGKIDRELVEAGANFLKRIRKMNKLPHQIVAMDKTSFYGDSRFVRNISIKGGYEL
jgi:hypothetical protein